MVRQNQNNDDLVSVVERYPKRKSLVLPVFIFICSAYLFFPSAEEFNNLKQKIIEQPLITSNKPDQNLDLHQLVKNASKKNIKRYLNQVDIKEINQVKHGMTPIMLAASRGDAKIIDILFKHGADPNKRGSMERTALLYAVEKNHIEAVKQLLSHGADIDAYDNGRLTPLVMAASRGYSELSLLFIKSGANVDIQHRDGWTALIDATAHGDEKVVKALLKAGANTKLEEKNGKTALDYAREYGFSELVKILSNES